MKPVMHSRQKQCMHCGDVSGSTSRPQQMSHARHAARRFADLRTMSSTLFTSCICCGSAAPIAMLPITVQILLGYEVFLHLAGGVLAHVAWWQSAGLTGVVLLTVSAGYTFLCFSAITMNKSQILCSAKGNQPAIKQLCRCCSGACIKYQN
jgi:hypothetical protein